MNLLVSDYDNTYELHYPNHDCLNILKMNKVAMGKFMEKGNKFCLSTGRIFVAIKNILKNLNFISKDIYIKVLEDIDEI